MFGCEVDHVAVAVRDIKAAMTLYCDALGASFILAGDNESQGFRWAQFRFPNGGKIELVSPIAAGFVQRFLDTRGEGVHHVTLKTGDIADALRHLEAKGVPVMGVSLDHEAWKEAFIHPRDGHGVLIQIAQARYTDDQLALHHLSDHSASGHRHILEQDL